MRLALYKYNLYSSTVVHNPQSYYIVQCTPTEYLDTCTGALSIVDSSTTSTCTGRQYIPACHRATYTRYQDTYPRNSKVDWYSTVHLYQDKCTPSTMVGRREAPKHSRYLDAKMTGIVFVFVTSGPCLLPLLLTDPHFSHGRNSTGTANNRTMVLSLLRLVTLEFVSLSMGIIISGS